MTVLKWVVISTYAEHVRKLVTQWLSMRENLLLVNWACVKISYSLAVQCAYCLTSLFLASRPMSSVSRLCSLPPALNTLSHVSVSCLLSSEPCLTWSVPCLQSSFIRPLSLVCHFWSSIPQFLSFFLLFPVLFSSVSSPLSLVFHTCENSSFFCIRYTYAIIHSLVVGALDGWLRADMYIII
jgi:hypothetical protein